MRPNALLQILKIFWLSLLLTPVALSAQAGFDDDRVMLQGFYWESYRHGNPEQFPGLGKKKWYEIITENAAEIRRGRFDLIWLPPPSFAGERSAGYNPKEYFNLSNSYGNHQQHRAMLEALLQNGVEPVADIVINHRDGSTGWANFRNPDWDTWAVTRNDEAFTNPNSDVFNTPPDMRGQKRSDLPSIHSTGGQPTATTLFGILITPTHWCVETSYAICCSSSRWAIEAGVMTWFMVITPAGSPLTIAQPARLSQ